MPNVDKQLSKDPLTSIGVPTHGFLFAPTDDTVIIDPNTSKKVVATTITTLVDGSVKVTYVNSETPVVLPMLAGVRRSGQFTKVWETGTTSEIVSGGVVLEY